MEDKICLITGATSGIGLVTARTLAQRGASVVLVGRDATRAKTTAEEIQRQTGNAAVEYLVADLSSQAQVRRLAEEFSGTHEKLDVLINNAGALFSRRQESVDGLEMTFALNHLAPFLLTNLLLERLRASAPARIVTVASMAHSGATIPFDDLQQTHHPYRGLRVYGQSKLANILFTYELARRVADTGVTANTLHPGVVGSNFAMNNGGIIKYGYIVARPFMLSTEKGAQTSVYLATSPDVASVSGQYFVKCRPTQSSPASYDQDAARRLWEISEQLTGLSARSQSA
ncbi:MAG TPA: SDR family oxidoreductase [Ktedonobacterales bacterium]